jgi:hypothetical protein
MKKLIVLFLAAILIISCTNEKKSLYEKSKEIVKENLKSPSSAKFADYDEKNIEIKLQAGKEAPLLKNVDSALFAKMKPETKEKVSKLYAYDEAFIYGDYEAQNSFGVMLRGHYMILFRRYEKSYCGGKDCDWQLISKNID